MTALWTMHSRAYFTTTYARPTPAGAGGQRPQGVPRPFQGRPTGVG